MGLSEEHLNIEPWNQHPCPGVSTKRKMHILKKIKKRLGLARRNSTTCPGPNNLPPLQFHQVHGDNIRISRDGTLARRYESFCRAITFSARPVRINERVCVRFAEISYNWSGGIRFGFTKYDPATLENALPKYACPDLTSRAGFWAKALNEEYCEKDNVLFYYVNSAGDVIYGVNGEEKGVILSGIDTRGLLWTLIDIYGNCTGIEFLDARFYMYINSRHNRISNSNRSLAVSGNEIERVVMPSMQSLNINDEMQHIRFTNNGRLIPVPFHATKGRNVRLSQDRFIATRTENNFCQGYVFTARPLRVGEKLIVQVLKTDPMYAGALALGLTSCNPATLQPSDLPDDSDFLLDRPEYWVVSKDIASQPQRWDEISFYVNGIGEVTIKKNQQEPVVVMHVDQSLQLWAFLDIYGSTQSVRVFKQPCLSSSLDHVNLQNQQQLNAVAQTTCSSTSQIELSPRRTFHSNNFTTSESVNSLNSHKSDVRKGKVSTPILNASAINAATNAPASASSNHVITVPSNSSDNMLQIPGGTVLVVNLPPTSSDISPIQLIPNQTARINQQVSVAACNANLPSTSSAALLNGSNIEMDATKIKSSEACQPLNQWKDGVNSAGENNAECTICYENLIDSVLYMCGHMCMCYECAIEQWRGVGGGHCPLCRAVIRDVIRTYTT